MRTYKIVKKEAKPTIPISKVNFDEGFILVESNEEAVGIIVQDDDEGVYSFIATFKDSFGSGIRPTYYDESLEGLMESLKNDLVDETEFTFIRLAE